MTGGVSTLSVSFLLILSGCSLHFPPVLVGDGGIDGGMVCGNGLIDQAESCDDGNKTDGDGCSSACKVEPGWSCSGQPSACEATCGDGIAAGQESCDGSDLRDATCRDLGHPSGSLACNDDCSIDASGCANCNDGVCDFALGETIDNCPADCGFVQLAVGFQTNCALRADGTVWCWGENDYGQLGLDETTAYSAIPVLIPGVGSAIHVDVGGHHVCALVDGDATDRAVWCWGQNNFGQLGNTYLHAQPVPKRAEGLGTDITGLDVGWDVSCAVQSSEREVACWGISRNGLLGCPVVSTASPHPTPFVRTWNEPVEQVSCDAGGCCVRLHDIGQIACWGGNDHGQLGDGTHDSTCVPLVVESISTVAYLNMGDHYACAVDEAGTAWCWGHNDQLEAVPTEPDEDVLSPVSVKGLPPVASIWLGWHHTCATTTEGAAWCWGQNDWGQLGNGVTYPTAQPPVAVQGLDHGVIDAEAGWEHSCALLETGHVQCWGNNDLGQLGNGTTEPSTTPLDVAFP